MKPGDFIVFNPVFNVQAIGFIYEETNMGLIIRWFDGICDTSYKKNTDFVHFVHLEIL